ncbi:hypothetical protein J2W71_002616 [Pseudomonas sp. 3400]|nr:hypothetical protein [Pseudomonas sp. 3400]
MSKQKRTFFVSDPDCDLLPNIRSVSHLASALPHAPSSSVSRTAGRPINTSTIKGFTTTD